MNNTSNVNFYTTNKIPISIFKFLPLKNVNLSTNKFIITCILGNPLIIHVKRLHFGKKGDEKNSI